MRPKGPAARVRAQEKWASRARLTETSFAFLEAQRAEEERQMQAAVIERIPEVEDDNDWQFSRPVTETTSCFHLKSFKSLLLPDNNRPLDQSTLHKLKELFASTDATTTALHMLSVDCQVTGMHHLPC